MHGDAGFNCCKKCQMHWWSYYFRLNNIVISLKKTIQCNTGNTLTKQFNCSWVVMKTQTHKHRGPFILHRKQMCVSFETNVIHESGLVMRNTNQYKVLFIGLTKSDHPAMVFSWLINLTFHHFTCSFGICVQHFPGGDELRGTEPRTSDRASAYTSRRGGRRRRRHRLVKL